MYQIEIKRFEFEFELHVPILFSWDSPSGQPTEGSSLEQAMN